MEKKTQLFFKDNGHFVFRKLDLEDSSMLDKKGSVSERAFRHSYAGEYMFGGYKNMSADAVTLGFPRDIFLDPHDKIPVTDSVSGKPDSKNKKKVAEWIAQVATNRRQVLRAKAHPASSKEWIDFGLMTVIGFEIIGWLIRFATMRGYGS